MASFLLNFFGGVVIGGTLVGCSVERTISASRGLVRRTMALSVVNSVTYYFSISFIAHENICAYSGTCLGSLIAVWYISNKNAGIRRRKK